MTTDAGDPELAAMMGRGSGSAFDALFLRHEGAVRRLGVAILRDPDAADDLVQETFLQAWRHRTRYASERASVKTWLLAIARNQAIDLVRVQARHAGLVEAARGVARVAAGFPDSLSETVSRDEVARLHAVLGGLPSAQQRALLLAHWGGLTHEEVALCTGVALGTVKGRLRLGGQTMAQRLEPGRRRVDAAAA